MTFNFVKCPCCSGHEALATETARVVGEVLTKYLSETADLPEAVAGELQNIVNVIENSQQREEAAREEELEPVCPTPDKRKYSNLAHAAPFAAKWKQNAYQCACGWWHLSRQLDSEHSSKINSPAASADEFETLDVDPLML